MNVQQGGAPAGRGTALLMSRARQLATLARDRPPLLARVFVAAVVLGGGLVLAGVLLSGDPRHLAGPHPAAFAVFAVLLIVSELRPARLLRWQEVDVTVSWAFACALLLVSPYGGALLVLAVASLSSDLLVRRKRLSRAVFNAAQCVLSLAAGGALLDAAGYRAALVAEVPIVATYLLVAVATGLAVWLTNNVLVATVVALHAGTPVTRSIRAHAFRNVLTDGMLLTLAPILVVVAQRSLVLLPLVLVSAWAVYTSACQVLIRKHEAQHDPLTGLANRRAFDERAAKQLQDAARSGACVAAVVLDLDGFKTVNDRLGHEVGDLLLKAVAERLTAATRSQDLVARLGGDEFAVLMSDVIDADQAHATAARMHAAVEEPFDVLGFPVAIGGSFGIALFPDHGRTLAELVRQADIAMYAAKSQGGGVVLTHGESVADGSEGGRLDLLGELRSAVAQDQLLLHYQPKVESASGEIRSVEALVRWQHPTRGLILPAAFIPLAEHTELMGPFTQMVLDKALDRCAAWHEQGLYVGVAVNLSAHNLGDLRFPRAVAALLERHGVKPEWLELELTEHTLVTDPDRARAVLAELRAMGVVLSLDAFGTGGSSLTNLRDLPVHCLKIDRSFIQRIATDPRDAVIVAALIDLARTLGLRTVAEGIETEALRAQVTAMGCDVLQGYLLGRPMPAAEMTERLQRVHLHSDLTLGVSS